MRSDNNLNVFVDKYKGLLGDEAGDFFDALKSERYYGVRANTLKVNADFRGVPDLPFKTDRKIPWAEGGYYYGGDEHPGKHPYHEAGLYYIQEPSAMVPARVLDPQPGEKILDLCAAPGGKSTQISAMMRQKGLLISNEINPARAKILSRNIERTGTANSIVTNMAPGELANIFPAYFDGISVDAPCSGEGMFRKDHDAVNEWSPDRVEMCAARQADILENAAAMVKPGGRIVYSTCTFSPEENECVIAKFLGDHPEFSVKRPENIAGYFSEGRPEWGGGRVELKDTIRIWPHLCKGEGHFVALLVKDAGEDEKSAETTGSKRDRQTRQDLRKRSDVRAEFEEFAADNLRGAERLTEGRRPYIDGDEIYMIPDMAPGFIADPGKLKAVRPGLDLGTARKGRFEPSQALAMFLTLSEVSECAELGTYENAVRYLRGETLPDTGEIGGKAYEKSWVLMTISGFPLGWSKASGGMLKNHYPKGLRINF